MEQNTGARRASLVGLAIVGFIALVVLGLWLALYVARSLTGTGGLGAAADYVDSMFSSGSSSTLAVVPGDASTTISFDVGTTTYSQGGYAASTTPAATTTTTLAKTSATKTYAQGTYPTYYRTVTTTYPVPGATRIAVNSTGGTTHTYYGLPDLSVHVVAVGYLDSNGTFVATSTMPVDSDFAAKILVMNKGTNQTGPWDIKVTMATNIDSAFFHTETMSSLESGDSTIVDMTLDVGHPRRGLHDLSVTLDPADKLAESDESNNTDSLSYTAY